MSARVISFPGADPTKIKPRPTCIADLPEGAKALVIEPVGSRFMVSLQPAETRAEREVCKAFDEVENARYFARRMSIAFPRLYQLIVDDLPQRRQTQGEIVEPAPAGWDGAA